MRDFSDKVRHYALNPRHAGLLADANAVGEAGSLDRGHVLRLMLRIDPMSEVIEAARFLTFGGSEAIAASEALSRLVIGKTLAEAGKLTGADIAAALDGLPEGQNSDTMSDTMRGTALGARALEAAIAAFRGEVPPMSGPCEGAAQAHEPAPVQITPLPRSLPRRAPPAALAMSRRAQEGATAPRPPLPFPAHQTAEATPDAAPPLSAEAEAHQQARIAEIIEEMRPVFQRDGGDIALGSVEGVQVFVRLAGTCAGCMMAGHTLSALRARLVEALGRPFRVIPLGQR